MESILDCLDIAGPGRTRNIARKGRDDEHNLHVGFRYLKHEQQNTKSPLPVIHEVTILIFTLFALVS